MTKDEIIIQLLTIINNYHTRNSKETQETTLGVDIQGSTAKITKLHTKGETRTPVYSGCLNTCIIEEYWDTIENRVYNADFLFEAEK